MSYDTQKIELGREPFQIVEMDIGYCSLTYGVAPCTASIGGTGSQECYNTFATCQDTTNYADSVKTYRFCQKRSNLPVGENLIPSLAGPVQIAPTSTTAGQGLGNRSVVKITLEDHVWHDRDVDLYVDNRSYDPEESGTYWGKWIARNPFFEGRELRILDGFIGSPFSLADFKTFYFDISDISGPTNGKVTIQAKDILTRTYGRKAKYPAASVGELAADITDAATSATLAPAGIGNTDYPASGHISIGKEAMSFTRSGDALTLTRAQFGTEAKAHKAEDTAQLCATWTSVNVLTVLKELLTTGAGIPTSYIPDGAGENWDVELTNWLSTADLTGILLKPEPIDKVIAEISECFMFDLWWDAEERSVKVKALSPEPSGSTVNILTDDYNLLADSVSVKKDSKLRVSEIQVFYNKGDFSAKNDQDEFSSIYISIDPSASSAVEYGSENIRTIFCRWFADKGQAAALAGRLLNRFRTTPSEIQFSVDAKDSELFEMAGRVGVSTRHIQDAAGQNDGDARFQVTEIKSISGGSKLRVKGLSSAFLGRFWFIAPDGVADYTAASDTDKAKYAWICYDSGVFLDGEEAYKII